MEGEESIGDREAFAEWMRSAPQPASAKGDGEPRRVHPLVVVVGVVGVAVAVLMVLLRPVGTARADAAEELNALGAPSAFHAATITEVSAEGCEFVAPEDCVRVDFTLIAGPDLGASYVQEFTSGGVTPEFVEGQTAILSYRPPNGSIRSVAPAPCDFDETLACADLQVILLEGDRAGSVIEFSQPGEAGAFFVGDPVAVSFDEAGAVVAVSGSDLQTQYQFSDFQRRSILVWLLVVFAVAVIALGRLRGVAALAGLGATVVIILAWLLPAILDGRNPVVVSLVGAAAVAYVAIFLSHGFNLMSCVSLIGVLGGLLLTTLLATVTVELARFTGFASEESSLLSIFGGIDLGALVLAGMVLGAAGALDDVAVTQASAVWQLKGMDANLTFRPLFRRGLRIGQDHIGATVNTLLLAYLGAALPLAILFVLAQQSLGSVANSEVVAVEIVRTLVGSIGLVAVVPFTTWLAAITVVGPGTPTHPHP